MYQVGVTGGIGSGKTLVCSVFEKLGIPVYRADDEAKKLMNSDRGLREEVKRLLGSDVYSGATLNNKKVAGMVFEDPELLHRLNQLVHPAVGKDYGKWARNQKEAPYVIKETAILFESGAASAMDGTVLVFAEAEVRIRRVMARDGMDRNGVVRRMRHQMGDEEKMKKADHVIFNNGTEMLLPQIIGIHQKLLEKS